MFLLSAIFLPLLIRNSLYLIKSHMFRYTQSNLSLMIQPSSQSIALSAEVGQLGKRERKCGSLMNYFILQHFKPPFICSNTAFVLPTTFFKNVSKLWVATFGRVLKHWSRLSREAVESPFMEIFKTQLGTALRLYLLWPEGLACIRCRDDFQPQLFCDSVIQALVVPEITRGLMLYNFTKFLS